MRTAILNTSETERRASDDSAYSWVGGGLSAPTPSNTTPPHLGVNPTPPVVCSYWLGRAAFQRSALV